MRQIALLPLSLLFLSGWAAAQDCTALAQPQAQPAAGAAVAAELTTPRQRLGAPSGVLAQAYAEAQSVDSVLQRLRIGNCQVAAGKKAPGAAAATPAAKTSEVIDPATYKPKTEHDNTPWRFDMSQNGKRMTAEEFDAWMKARGVRVAKGAPKPADASAAAPASAPAAPGDGKEKK